MPLLLQLFIQNLPPLVLSASLATDLIEFHINHGLTTNSIRFSIQSAG